MGRNHCLFVERNGAYVVRLQVCVAWRWCWRGGVVLGSRSRIGDHRGRCYYKQVADCDVFTTFSSHGPLSLTDSSQVRPDFR